MAEPGEEGRRAAPALHECEARSILTWRYCGDWTDTRYEVACVHEHVVLTWLCPLHATLVAGFCRLCLENDGHRCAGFARVAPS